MTTIEDVKEFVSLMSEAISFHNAIKDIKNDSIPDSFIMMYEDGYEEVCKKLIQNRIVNSGGIYQGGYLNHKPKTDLQEETCQYCYSLECECSDFDVTSEMGSK